MPEVLTEAAIVDSLRSVQDPELRQSIVDLHMVRGVHVNADHVDVDVALTVAGCPLHQRIESDIKEALGRVEGVEAVNVKLSVMNDEERRQAFQAAFRLREATPAAAPPPPAAARPRERVEIPVIPRTAPGPALLQPSTPTAIIGVMSGKGGVGKSTVTANLAAAIARLGHRTGLMDIDVYGFSQGRLFGVRGEPRVNEDEKIVPWESHGVRLVSMGMFVPEDQAVVWRGPMLGKMMQQFFSDVAWGELDFLLMDLPPGTGDLALDVAQKVHHASLVLVTTPQAVATHVAARAANVAQRAGQTILGVVENMSFVRCPHGDRLEIFGHGGGEELARSLKVPLLGQVPLEAAVREGADGGRPIVLSDPDSEAAGVFLNIANRLIAARAS
jgi:ATP-binding protein involved in chromosome partitioning